MVAKKEDFGKCKKIPTKGKPKMSYEERRAQMEWTFKEVAHVVADSIVNPDTKESYPLSVIETAMRRLYGSVRPNVSIKIQALQFILAFYWISYNAYEPEKIRVIVPSGEVLRDSLRELAIDIELNEVDCHGKLQMVMTVDLDVRNAVSQLTEQERLKDAMWYR
ncbi:ribosome maturation protein SBDS-like [Tropilaelaps mercedesae]|uniref:Ribosome maturation protein SBDS-like n=1 Tax=Tropilaelaps mercedesae TaxID=418985 RepID=A0A1V9X386_9ACAR|nr:ribosome maturation protein SBDS-like [Tropilaelaps mercedesae]